MLRRAIGFVLAIGMTVAGLALPAPQPVAAANAASRPHVFWIVMENEDYSYAIQRPYTASLLKQYGYLTDYYSVTHPSLPNYLSLTSGAWSYETPGSSGGLDYPSNTPFTVGNIADQLATAGISWDAYAEDLPSTGYLGGNLGPYLQHHFPFVYYTDVADSPQMADHLQPLTGLAPLLSQPASAMPSYVWITPNVYDQGGDAGDGAGGATADHWLSQFVPQILASAAWQQGGVLIITWDENGSRTGTGGGNVLTMLISKNIPAGPIAGSFNDYSLLRSLEQAWDLPFLANAATSAPVPELVQALQPHSSCAQDAAVARARIGATTASVPVGSGTFSVTGLNGQGRVEAAVFADGCSTAWIVPGSEPAGQAFTGLRLAYCGYGDPTLQWTTASSAGSLPDQSYDSTTGCVTTVITTTTDPPLSAYEQ